MRANADHKRIAILRDLDIDEELRKFVEHAKVFAIPEDLQYVAFRAWLIRAVPAHTKGRRTADPSGA